MRRLGGDPRRCHRRRWLGGVELERPNPGFDGLLDNAKVHAVGPRDPVTRKSEENGRARTSASHFEFLVVAFNAGFLRERGMSRPALHLFLEAHRLGEHARDVSGGEDNLDEAVAAVSVGRGGRLKRGA